MLNSRSYEEILNDLCSRVVECSVFEGSMIYTALAPYAFELALAYARQENAEKNSHADTADYDGLKAIGKDRGLVPEEATQAKGIGKFDKEIPIGSRFQINSTIWVSDDRREINDDYFYYNMHTEQTGTSVNSAIGRLTPITFVSGLTYSYLIEITVPAEDEETQGAFLERYYASFNRKTFGGNKADYIDKINSYDGVGGCKIYPIWNGGGTVKLVIINSSFEKPSTTLIDEIQTDIDPVGDAKGDGYAPIGHVVTIVPVDNNDVTISATFTLSDGVSFGDIKDQLKTAVKTYLLSQNELWSSSEYLILRIAQITTVLLSVTGIVDVQNVKINNLTTNYEIDKDEIFNLIDVVEGS